MNNKVLLLGEPILDVTIPLITPERTASLYGRAESTVFEQQESTVRTLGGVLYWARFLNHFIGKGLVVLMPMPNGGHRHGYATDLLRDLVENNFIIHPVDVKRNLASILRCVEIERTPEIKPKQFPRSLLRVDAGDSHRFNEKEIDSLVIKLKDLNDQWLSKGTSPKYLVLADYNLGLFTHYFLREINKIINNDVNIIVYARRKWQKYADCFMKNNCTIIADSNETIAELTDSEANLHDEEDIVDNPVRCIRAKFPWLKQIILVDKQKTIFAKWQTVYSLIEFTHKKKRLFMPTGYRAIIAACLCIDDLIHKQEDFLYKAHFAADYGGAILDGTFSGGHAKTIRTHTRKPGVTDTLKIPSIDTSPVNDFICQFCCNGMKMELSKAKTRVPDYYTVDKELKNKINDLVSEIESRNNIAISLFDPSKYIFVQKVLFQGHSSSGKTFLAKKIAEHIFKVSEEDAILHCNVIAPKSLKAHNAAEEIIKFIKDGRNIVILDEIGNMGNRGAQIQKLLLTKFDNYNDRAKIINRKILILTASFLDEQIDSIAKNNKENNLDFYKRFPRRLSVPDLSIRHLDPVYTISVKLFEIGIREISLRCLAAIADLKFSSYRDIKGFIDQITVLSKGRQQLDNIWLQENAQKLSLHIPQFVSSMDSTRVVTLVK